VPRRQTFSYWVSRVKKLSDKESDDHVAAAEYAECLSEVFGDLYSITAEGADAYWQTTHTIVANGSVSYDEPDDHLSTVCLEYVSGSGERRPLTKLLAQERYTYSPSSIGLIGGSANAYSLIDDQLFLYPKPTSGTYELLYIPQPPDLTSYADTDMVDVVSIYGEQFLVYGAAALVKSKSEDDVRFFLQRQARAEQKLIEWAAQRSFHDGQHRFSDFGGGDD